jgi:hypothetical protein
LKFKNIISLKHLNKILNLFFFLIEKQQFTIPLKRKSAKLPSNRSSIINANSWKDCEILVNEHYKKIKEDGNIDSHRVTR